MLLKYLFLVTTLIFTNSVIRQVDGSHEEWRKGKFVEPRYHFNHPPSAEYYNPIPVSIVYEEDSSYSGKSDYAQSTETEENLKVNLSIEKDGEKTSIQEENVTTSTPVSNFEKKTNTEIKTKPQTLNDFQIPVSIMYESESEYNRNFHRTKTDTKTNKRRPSYSRKLQDKANEDNLNERAAQVDTEKPQAGGGTFKKRIGGKAPVIPILESESYVFSHNGNFHYSYESGDGTKAHSEGKSVKVDDDTGSSVVGGFSYTDKDGNDFSLSYTADENGYRPVGDHLPTPPPIPPAIARALAYLATAPSEPVTERPVKAKLVVKN